jgi:hypothetical protein
MNDIVIRLATTDDVPAVLSLLRVSMQRDDDERFEALFRWKHLENVFGASPVWIACAANDVVAIRPFLKWEFECCDRGRTIVRRAVRAVDTATHPDFQGRGLFTTLTLAGLEHLRRDGTEFVFNTPNSQSRPGYLKMGWHDIGRAKVGVRPTSWRGARMMRRGAVAAEHWSLPTRAGLDAAAMLDDARPIEALLEARRPGAELRTRLTMSFLRWRYGGNVIPYRAVVLGSDPSEGVAFVRVRRRGSAREAALALALVPSTERAAARRLHRAVVRTLRDDADYVLAVGGVRPFVPVPHLGPWVTSRPLAAEAPMRVGELALSLGDVELF